jgi:TonB-linked SusC/RagA family outer membrane protein
MDFKIQYFRQWRKLTKMLLIMKLIAMLLFLISFKGFATGAYAQNVSLDFKNVPLKKVFKEIQKQTGYYFLYTVELLERVEKENLVFQNASLQEVMNKCLQNTELTYSIVEKTIVIKSIVSVPDIEVQAPPMLIPITGKVTDDKGQPLAGASILVKGSGKGTKTDANGSFSINAEPNSTLIISYVGFENTTIKISNLTTISVQLKPSFAVSDQVVVIGYGAQKKSNLTSAVTQISGEVLQNRPLKSVSEGLQGVIAGLNVDNVNGSPESNPSLNIRGFTGINSQGSPLVLVDGVERNLGDINPNDVEGISVLKDAAASAIYGSRAPYGVILVTTKTGKKGGKARVNYNGMYLVGTPIGMPQWANSWEFAEKINEKYRNNLQAVLFTDATIQKMKDFGAGKLNTWNDPLPNGQWGAHYDSYANNDWFSTMFKDQVPSQQHNIDVSGGSNNTTYYMGVGYNDASGLIVGSNDKRQRYTSLLKVKSDVTNWLSLGLNMNYVKNDETGLNYRGRGRDYADMMNSAAASFPNWADLSPNGSPYWLSSGPSMRGDGGNAIDNTNDFLLSGRFELKPIKGLNINGSYSWKNTGNHAATISLPIISVNEDGTTRNSGRSVTQSQVRRVMSTANYHTADLTASYSKQIRKHSFQVMAGYQEEYYNTVALIGDRKDLYTNAIPVLHTTYNAQPILDDALSHWATQGLFGRFSYNFKEKYLFEFNGRYDAHSKFPTEIRWAYFPSFSAGWNIAKENFWKFESVSSLKIRGSYTSSGDNGSGNYLYLPTMGTAVGTKDVLLEGARPNMVSMPGLVSPTLTWAKPRTIGIGIDAVAFKNKLEVSWDWYQRTTYDQAGPAEVLPVTLGTAPPQTNNSVSETRGWEFTANWRDRAFRLGGKQVSYSVNFNISDYIGYVVKYNSSISGARSGTWTPGEVFGELYVYPSNGIAQNAADIAKNVVQTGGWNVPGDLMLRDINGDGRITTGDGGFWYSQGDRKKVGYTYPRYRYGLNLQASWNGFDISVQLTGVPYWKIYSSNYYVMPSAGDQFNSKWFVAQRELGTWTNETPGAFYPRYSFKTYAANDQYLIDLAHLNVKNLRIGYQLPANILSKIKTDRVYIYTSIENLGYIYYNSFVKYDPEILQNYGGSGYPPQRQYSFGLNIRI